MAGNVYTLHFKLTDGTEVPVEFIVPQGVSVTGAQINDEGHLIITLSDGNTIDAGEVKGGGTSDLNLVNGKAVGSLRSVGAIPETDEYKLGQYAVALGPNTMASKNSSFAVGRATQANGNSAFAEGTATIAKGDYSHAEGNMTIAYSECSHAEGYGTSAYGRCSHSEGENTSADSDHQHVQGKYNKYDHDGKYAHIVGNGTDENNRSNAHTLDWNGNAWFAGDVIVGGTGQDDTDAKVLATREYVDQKVGEIEIPEVPSLDGYATEQYVNDKVGDIKIPEIPTALPNPNALTFSGAVNGSYDGSAPLSVNIPDGVKSWNDLTDKPFDMKKTVVLPETALVGNMDDGSTTITDPLSIEPVVGKTYVVNWHGKKYECVAGEVDIDFMCTYLGNVGAAGAPGAEDTGEPFMILFVPSAYAPVVGFTAAIYALDGSTGGVVSVDYVEVIKKIDEALLPKDYINALIDAKIAAMMQNNA